MPDRIGKSLGERVKFTSKRNPPVSEFGQTNNMEAAYITVRDDARVSKAPEQRGSLGLSRFHDKNDFRELASD